MVARDQKSEQLRSAQLACCDAITELAPLFVPEMEFLLLCYHPDGPDRSMVVGSVEIDTAIACLQKLKERPCESAEDLLQ